MGIDGVFSFFIHSLWDLSLWWCLCKREKILSIVEEWQKSVGNMIRCLSIFSIISRTSRIIIMNFRISISTLLCGFAIFYSLTIPWAQVSSYLTGYYGTLKHTVKNLTNQLTIANNNELWNGIWQKSQA